MPIEISGTYRTFNVDIPERILGIGPFSRLSLRRLPINPKVTPVAVARKFMRSVHMKESIKTIRSRKNDEWKLTRKQETSSFQVMEVFFRICYCCIDPS